MIGGTIEGDANAMVSTFAKIEEGQPGALSFLANAKYTEYIYKTQSTIVLVDEAITLTEPVEATLIRTKNAYEAVAKLMQIYESMTQRKTGIDPLAFISPSAKIGKDCYIAPFAYIGENVTIGDNCTIYPHVCIYHDCVVGNRCVIHAGAVIGADGFGFAPTADGYEKIPQIGIVTIEDDVEIGANTCIDRSTMGSTYVRHGVKLDNLVQIAHNTDIGANTVFSSQVGIAGSTKVGEWCMFGGQVGVAGHITIGDRVMLGAQSGVPSSLESNQTLIGTPPMPQRDFFRQVSYTRRLGDMLKKINQLEQQINELKANNS